MELDNRTALPVLWLPGRMEYPRHSLTLVVKGTFELEPDAPARLVEEQLPIGPDVPFPDDDDPSSAPYYDSDLAHFKPRADRLLVGRCHAPGGRPVAECRATFGVGKWSRTLRIVGDRYWDRGLLRARMSDPEPFQDMDLGYTHAFGGAGYAANPKGTGFAPGGKLKSGTRLALPNLEDPQAPITTPTDHPPPAGFGPLSRTWAPRSSRLGTYGQAWLASRAPWFPEDLDWRAFNAASDEARTGEYLRGDEPVKLENLRPDRPRFAASLPGQRVRCFVWRDPSARGPAFAEVPMNLDTLWIDAETLRLVLVWRGICEVASPEFEDLLSLHVVEESTRAPDRPADAFRQELAPPSAIAPPPPGRRLKREDVESLLEGSRVLSGDDLSGLDLTGLDLSGADLSRADLRGARLVGVNGAGAVLSGANLDGADLSEGDFSGADFSRASLRDAVLDAALLREAILWRADLAAASLVDADLFGADLSYCNLEGADLRGASLFAAILADATTQAARLDGANLRRTRLAREDETV